MAGQSRKVQTFGVPGRLTRVIGIVRLDAMQNIIAIKIIKINNLLI